MLLAQAAAERYQEGIRCLGRHHHCRRVGAWVFVKAKDANGGRLRAGMVSEAEAGEDVLVL